MKTSTPKRESKSLRKLAFTLAEVIIVIGVIGTVANMTLPGLVYDVQDKAAVIHLKKNVSVFQSAISMAITNEGSINSWYTGSDLTEAIDIIGQTLSKYLKTTNNCGAGVDSDCIPLVYGTLNTSLTTTYNYNTASYLKMALNDGTSIIIRPSLASGQLRIDEVAFDINGVKTPNRYGYDLFNFAYYDDSKSLFPTISGRGAGSPKDPRYLTGDLSSICSKDGTSSIGSGVNCVRWALFKENRDYIHCNDLNWETKSTCD